MTLELPTDAGSEREAAIVRRVLAGEYDPIRWAGVTSVVGDHAGTFMVFADALMMDGVRINVSAETQQLIADELDCLLLTPKLADLIWDQREVSLPPFPRGNTTGMSTTQAMVEHSAKIDAALARLTAQPTLIATVGKHWVIDNDFIRHPRMACNYGWHFVGPNFQGITGEAIATNERDEHGQIMRLIQGRGWRHDIHHTDYSQTCVLVSRTCTIDGAPMTLGEVLQDAGLAALASHQGVMSVQRQPGVA
jgi:hypothetical protein